MDAQANPVPLSHHEVMSLAEPFIRAGYITDLGSSRRSQREIVFLRDTGSVRLAGGIEGRSELTLQSSTGGRCQLTRTVRHAGLVARLRASGRDPAALLETLESVSLERQLVLLDGTTPIAFSHDIGPDRQLLLASAVARVAGVEFSLSLPSIRGVAADLSIQALDATPWALPEDLLAVLGWDWSPISMGRGTWRGRLRLRGVPARRSAGAEQAMRRAVHHLHETLCAPPAQFHQRLRYARWGVVARRMIPWLTVALLAVAVSWLPRLLADPSPATVMLIFHVPTILIAFSFCLQERATFELPPWPRRSEAPDWTAPATGPAYVAPKVRPLRWWSSPFR